VNPDTRPADPFRLDNRVVVLTGASSGLGRGFARALAVAGAALVLAARRLEQLEQLAAELAGGPGGERTRVEVVRADVSSPEDCQRVAEVAATRFGRVDVLVNNAGLGTVVPASKETPEGFRQVIEVNLNGAFWMSQACQPLMPEGSSVVNVASSAATCSCRPNAKSASIRNSNAAARSSSSRMRSPGCAKNDIGSNSTRNWWIWPGCNGLALS